MHPQSRPPSLDFIARRRKGVVQPAVKVRGREYLRITYGPDYTRPETLDRLRQRGLGLKRSLPAESSPSASKRSNASCAASRCTVCTRRYSRSSPWRASRSTPGCEPLR